MTTSIRAIVSVSLVWMERVRHPPIPFRRSCFSTYVCSSASSSPETAARKASALSPSIIITGTL